MKRNKTIIFPHMITRQVLIASLIMTSPLFVLAQENDSVYISETNTNKNMGFKNKDTNADQTETNENYEKLQQRIWKRKKYLYIGYGTQKLKSDYYSINSDMSFSILLAGRTIYLHKKPIAGRIKFGIDTNLDANFAKYPEVTSVNATSSDSADEDDSADLDFMHLDVGFGIGPSITYNPVNQLKATLYFHVTPTYSMITQNDEIYKHYTTFFNIGMTLSYKVISLGVENRWCGKTNFDNVILNRIDKIYDDNGVFQDPFKSIGNKLKTNTFRVFIGFRW